MNTAVVNVRIDTKLKSQAQRVAGDMGFSLSSLVNAFLKNLVKTKTVHFEAEEPSEYLIKSIKKADEDFKVGRTRSFDNVEDAIAWLNRNVVKKKNAR